MGQPLPLPNKIPMPTYEQKKLLIDMGIIILDMTKEVIDNQEFVCYILPHRWRVINDSWRPESPIFCILDENDFVRVTIRGSWNGAYKNYLNMEVVSGRQSRKMSVSQKSNIQTWMDSVIESEIAEIIKDTA